MLMRNIPSIKVHLGLDCSSEENTVSGASLYLNRSARVELALSPLCWTP